MSPSNWKVSDCFVKMANTSDEILESKAQPSTVKANWNHWEKALSCTIASL